MQSLTIAATRGLSIIIFLLFLPNIFTAQVKIKEKIEIAPKIKNSYKVNSSSTADTTIPLLFYDAAIGSIMTTRPCQINASGYIDPVWGEYGHGYSVMFIDGFGWKDDWTRHIFYLIWDFSIDDAPVSFEYGGCDGFPVLVYRGGAQGDNELPGDLGSGNTVTYTSEFARATVIATPLPAYELDTCTMTPYPTGLDANDYGIHEAFITTKLYNGSGGPFDICPFYNPPLSIKFKIENPLGGMTIKGGSSDGSGRMVEDTSIECYFSSTSYVWFEWDGSDIPKEIDTVSIRAEAYGASGVLKIQLKKIIPHHFTVTPEVNPIYAGESVVVRAIAKNRNDEEVALDGGKSITFSDESGIGSFIVGSDTIPNQATVTYDQAKSGSIKYYSKLDTSILVDQGVWIDAALTEHPERNGYGYLNVITSCLEVKISKTKMSPGDTAAVILMARKKDGTVPYPPDQDFSLWMKTDEQYGRLRCISTGEEGSYIYGQQPFEFIATNSIDVDSTVVEIEASIGGGIAGSIGIGTKDKLHLLAGSILNVQTSKSKIGITDSIRAEVMERNTIRSYEKLRKRLSAIREKAKNKSQFDKILAKIETQYLGTNEAAKNTINTPKPLAKAGQIAMSVEEGESCEPPIADVTIKKKSCEDAPQCQDPSYLPPTFKVVTHPNNGFGGVTICNGPDDLGAFLPIDPQVSDKFIEPITMTPCYDPNTDKLKFSVDGSTIQLNAILDLCDDNIRARHAVLVGNWTQINPADSCDALQDMRDHYKYPVGVTRWGGYLFANVLLMHEMQHQMDFEDIVLSQEQGLASIPSQAEVSCSSVKNIIDSQKEVTEKIKKWTKNVVNDIMVLWQKRIGKKGSADRKKYEEKDTQGGFLVTSLIKSQIDQIQAKYKCP